MLYLLNFHIFRLFFCLCIYIPEGMTWLGIKFVDICLLIYNSFSKIAVKKSEVRLIFSLSSTSYMVIFPPTDAGRIISSSGYIFIFADFHYNFL